MPEAQGFLISENLSLISYLNFCQFNGGMFLVFFLISGVLGYIFKYFTKICYSGLENWPCIVKFDLFCKILFFWYTFDPKVPTYKTFQGISYLNWGSAVS